MKQNTKRNFIFGVFVVGAGLLLPSRCDYAVERLEEISTENNAGNFYEFDERPKSEEL